MKLVALLSLGVLAIASATNVALMPTVQAESRTPGEATAHALDELANCRAQRRPECPTETATPTLTPTWTPAPTSTSTPQPTDTPTPVPIAAPALEPCWLTDELGEVVFDQDGAPVPCPLEDQPSPVDEPTPTAEPTVASTETPVPVRSAQAVARVASAPAPAVAPAPPEPLPTYTLYPTYTPQAIWTPQATRSAASTPLAATTATRTPVPTGTATATPTVRPVLAASERAGAEPPNVPWGMLAPVLAGIAAVFGVCWLGITIKRRTVVRKPRPPREDVYA